MSGATFADQVAAAVDRVYANQSATAAKRGRNPRWPYVPIIRHADRPLAPTEQILRRAFPTRAEAVGYAEAVIDARRASFESRLTDPTSRALREHHGLPRELPLGV